ncbi:MAG TPA: tetratricopeptide repeat protein [Thermoanaerobaculia bacterium]|nr:tetratricopeptide repeat protein [Thermoanaerobaculia bacterium]
MLLAVRGPAAAQESPPEAARPAGQEAAPAPPPVAAPQPPPPSDEPAEPALVEVPEPSLEGLEPAVAEQLASARRELERYYSIEQAPPAERAEAYGELGRLYHVYELAAPAEAAYRNAHSLSPGDPRWAYYLAYLLQGGGRFEEAAELYGRILAIEETLPALVHLGESYLELGRLDEAESALRRVLAGAPESPSARALMGQIALSRGEHALAVDYLQSALAAVPQATRLHYPLALAYRGLGEMEKAQEHLALRGEIGVRPPDPLIDELEELRTGERVHLLRGRTAFRFGDFEAAVREFRQAVAAEPESVAARNNLGSALGQLGDRIGAIHQFRQVLERAPDNVTAHFNLGLLLGLEGAAEEAVAHLERATALAPGDGEAWRLLAEALVRLGRSDEALAAYTRAAGPGAFDPDIRLGEVQLLVNLGRFADALQRLDETHAIMPRNPRVVNAYARFLAGSPDPSLRDGERALELIEPLVEVQPTAAHVETLALSLAEAGRCDEAAQWQQRVIQAFQQAGDTARLDELQGVLARYDAGAPCRAPASVDE